MYAIKDESNHYEDEQMHVKNGQLINDFGTKI